MIFCRFLTDLTMIFMIFKRMFGRILPEFGMIFWWFVVDACFLYSSSHLCLKAQKSMFRAWWRGGRRQLRYWLHSHRVIFWETCFNGQRMNWERIEHWEKERERERRNGDIEQTEKTRGLVGRRHGGLGPGSFAVHTQTIYIYIYIRHRAFGLVGRVWSPCL